MDDFFSIMNKVSPDKLSPLVLAYIGDAVFELFVRTYLISNVNKSSNSLTNYAKKYVSATAQSSFYYSLQQILTEKEIYILKRGRNANPSHKAKNASVAEYRNATGLEALFGFLYLSNKNERLLQIFNFCYENRK